MSNRKRAPGRTYAGVASLPGTFESATGYPTSYTFNKEACEDDPYVEDNPFSTDDVIHRESRTVEWNQ
jgi:hypothetical protein